jgi:hypothetical protein
MKNRPIKKYEMTPSPKWIERENDAVIRAIAKYISDKYIRPKKNK